MPAKAMYQHLYDLMETVDDCAKNGRLLPCLALVYAGMDVMASLDSEPSEGVRAAFVRWVEKFMLPATELNCTALDLYAARCGVLHTFTADSDLYAKGKARKIAYAWGLGTVEELERTNRALGYSEWVCLHVADLIQAFREGVATHLEHVEADAGAATRLETASNRWFSSYDGDSVKEFLAELPDN